MYNNQPFDDALELSDDEQSVANSPQPDDTKQDRPYDEAFDLSSDNSFHGDDDSPRASRKPQPSTPQPAAPPPPTYVRREEAPHMEPLAAGDMGVRHADDFPMPSPGADDDSLASPNAGPAFIEGMYDPADYQNLDVSPEIAELFQYIGRYRPHQVDLDTRMRPFMPEYIPAAGELDAFVKVPRPDGKPDNLGLAVLDEPATNQSDPTVFALQLRAVSKASGAQPMLTRSLEHAQKYPKQVTAWISSINELHRHKPAPSVRYSKPMPDVEALMQIWDPQFEELLDGVRLPDAELSLETADLVRAMCALLDIPVYSSLTESLHVLFTLYSDFKANVHFQAQFAEMGEQAAMM